MRTGASVLGLGLKLTPNTPMPTRSCSRHRTPMQGPDKVRDQVHSESHHTDCPSTQQTTVDPRPFLSAISLVMQNDESIRCWLKLRTSLTSNIIAK